MDSAIICTTKYLYNYIIIITLCLIDELCIWPYQFSYNFIKYSFFL